MKRGNFKVCILIALTLGVLSNANAYDVETLQAVDASDSIEEVAEVVGRENDQQWKDCMEEDHPEDMFEAIARCK